MAPSSADTAPSASSFEVSPHTGSPRGALESECTAMRMGTVGFQSHDESERRFATAPSQTVTLESMAPAESRTYGFAEVTWTAGNFCFETGSVHVPTAPATW